jgi:hypothetical protein
MELETELKDVGGAQELFDWFGYWPSFHDATVLSFQVNLTESSHLRLHTWEMTDRVDERGFFILTKHVVVEFILEDISKLDLEGFSGQDVILGLAVHKVDFGFKLTIDPCCNLGGEIIAGNIAIRLFPGKPTGRRLEMPNLKHAVIGIVLLLAFAASAVGQQQHIRPVLRSTRDLANYVGTYPWSAALY